MIVIDTSALMAILNAEPEAADFVRTLRSETPCVIAAPTLFEFLMVAIGRKQEAGRAVAQALIDTHAITTVDWTAAHADIATGAFERFGKGRGNRAQLNFGDCMAYALAKSLDAPLLFKGDDFAQTDIRAAV